MSYQTPPETTEGWAMLHQFYNFNRSAFSKLSPAERSELSSEISEWIRGWETPSDAGQSAAFHAYGHVGNLVLFHFRKDFEQLGEAELDIERLGISEFFKPDYSYLSVVELGMYSATVSVAERLKEKGLEPGTDEWKNTYAERINEVRESLMERRFLEIPEASFMCFYPMNKKRDGEDNWYTLGLEERNMHMGAHGRIGRGYKGRVTQIISGSIGFDDWEWGVNLFSEDPLVFKDLVYRMRFDEGSARYGEFGPFYFGRRLRASELPAWLGKEKVFGKAA